jgi:two-component system chemotaxis response regulator CheB
MVSSVTRGGAAQTLKALELGAYDFITKPELNSEEENIAALKKSFARILGADLESYSPGEHTHHATLSATTPFAPTLPVQSSQPFRAPPAGFRAKIVAIGTSTGGPNALSALLPRLPADFPLPILIVQHMPQLFTASFAEALNKKCALQVVEAQQGMALQAATAYVAPGGMQMKLAGTPAAHDVRIQLTDDPAEHFCKPSVDYLFRSVAQVYELEAIGVILTGMGSDGTLGLKLLKRRGAYTMCQDKHSCVVYGMPREAVEAGVIDAQLTLGEIASTLQALAPRV